jgi:hypothetical protein
MVTKGELIEWLLTLRDEDCIGVDEEGLTLRVNAEDSEEYFEIGGIPPEGDE